MASSALTERVTYSVPAASSIAKLQGCIPASDFASHCGFSVEHEQVGVFVAGEVQAITLCVEGDGVRGASFIAVVELVAPSMVVMRLLKVLET